jgi:hypothetical protein
VVRLVVNVALAVGLTALGLSAVLTPLMAEGVLGAFLAYRLLIELLVAFKPRWVALVAPGAEQSSSSNDETAERDDVRLCLGPVQ